MPSSRTGLLLGITGGILTAGMLVIAAPGAVDWYHGRHQQESSYATGRVAKTDRASMPRWLPDTATEVRYRMSTTGGDRLLKATLPQARLPQGCKPGTPLGHAQLKAPWFPRDAYRHATAVCGGTYNAVLHGDNLYAWQDDATWTAAKKEAHHHHHR
jgi:hypothetical protein